MKKLLISGAVSIYVISTVLFCFLTVRWGGEPAGAKTEGGLDMNATDLGVMCISAAYPSMGIELADSRDNEEQPPEQNSEKDLKDDSGSTNEASQDQQTENPVVTGEEPLVLIVHTHATESYLPASGGNYHSKGEENTVRDVGNTLAATLEAQGIPVVHDKTLHDDPSYNSSYSRSYETVQNILEKYPTIRCVIDLHRDAVSSDSPASTVSVGGKNCARYSYVVGTGAATYQSNIAFVSSLNKTASESYSGFTGKVLERGYKYNQDLSAKYLLLEIGYNTNQIEDCRNTAEVFGNILAQTLKKG